MRRILDIGHNDLRVFFKSKSAYVWLFVLPTAFVYFGSYVARGPGDPSNHWAPVAVKNRDTNFLGRIFIDVMTNQGVWAANPTNAAAKVAIPRDFTERVLRGERTQVEFSRKEGGDDANAALVQLRFVRALVEVNSDILQAAPGPITEARLREIMARPNPVTVDAHFAGRKPMPVGFNFSLPGNLVLYLLLNVLVFGGASMATVRRNGILRRLATSPATRLEIVMGKIYGNTLLGAAQIAYYLFIGKVAFHVNIGANLPGVLLILILLAWAAGALGVFVGSWSAAEDRVVPICVLVSLLLGALGGCWWPMEIAPPVFQKVAMCLPTGWALSGLHQLISFGSGIGAALWPAVGLFAFGAVANALAIRFFRL